MLKIRLSFLRQSVLWQNFDEDRFDMLYNNDEQPSLRPWPHYERPNVPLRKKNKYAIIHWWQCHDFPFDFERFMIKSRSLSFSSFFILFLYSHCILDLRCDRCIWLLKSTIQKCHNYVILDILEDTRKYWTRCDNIGRVEDESNIVTSSPNISLYPPKTGHPILLLLFRSPQWNYEFSIWTKNP